MEISEELADALRRLVAAWELAEVRPRDVQLQRRAAERVALLVTLARQEVASGDDRA